MPCVFTITPQADPNGEMIIDGQANASNMMCISKARLGDYVCTLSSADMKGIDEAIAKSVDLMTYYAELSKKLAKKETYITKIKAERNRAEDELAELRLLLGLKEEESIKGTVQKILKTIDTQESDC